MPSLTVELAERSYPIEITAGLAGPVAETVRDLAAAGRPAVVLTDANVHAAQAGFFAEAFGGAGTGGAPGTPTLVLPPGETSKSLAEFGRALDFCAAQRVDRTGCLFAVGGGVVGDLGGYVAASYLRGIDYYQVPTSLLAMVDSSVGGKTGINLAAGKNLVGAFLQPRAVWADTGLLATLPPREFAAGMAEVIKYGLLADAGLFGRLEALGSLSPASPELPGIIHDCCAIKAAVVVADEREEAASGGRALLNLGHTFGHAIEAVAGYGDYLHGEAIAVGLVLAARLSRELGHLGDDDVTRVEKVVAGYGLPVALRAPLPTAPLLEAMRRDKKVRRGQLRFVAMEAIGRAVTVEGVEPARVEGLWAGAGAG